MRYQLIEYDTGMIIGTASEDEREAYRLALQNGNRYIMRGYHGYMLKEIVKRESNGKSGV